MNISSRCILCLLNKEEASIRSCSDEHQKAQYLKDVMRVMLDADPADTMPWIPIRFDCYSRPYQEGFRTMQK